MLLSFHGCNKLFCPSTLLMTKLVFYCEKITLTPTALAYLYHGLGRVRIMIYFNHHNVEVL